MEQMLQGRGDKIKAYSIAVDVFGRPASFDPAINPIVRIEASRLRASLVHYYELHGQEGGLRIDLPRGRYVPAVSRLDPGARAEFSASRPGQDMAATGEDGASRLLRLVPSTRSIWAATSIGVGAGLLGAHLPFAGQPTVAASSEKPGVLIEAMTTGGDIEGDVQQMRGELLVALGRFQTLEILQPTGDSGRMSTSSCRRLRLSITARPLSCRVEVSPRQASAVFLFADGRPGPRGSGDFSQQDRGGPERGIRGFFSRLRWRGTGVARPRADVGAVSVRPR